MTPLGEIVAIALRGGWMGNRGILHRDDEIVRSHRSTAWITCRLEFKSWQAPQWAAGHYTPLFFHDEAVALAAGHRPCALCRRPAFQAYREATFNGADPQSAKQLDRTLHAERLIAGTRKRRLHLRDWSAIPDGAFVQADGLPCLLLGATLIEWTERGYTGVRPRPTRGEATVITPPATLGALAIGYPVHIDCTATYLGTC